MNVTKTLSQFDKLVLSVSELDLRLSHAAIAKKIGARSARVAATLQRLTERKIVRSRVFLNEMALGLSEVKILFSLGAHEDRERSMVLKRMCATPGVSWLGSFAGDYQYGVVFFCSNFNQIGQFIEDIGSSAKTVFSARTVNPQLSYTQFARDWGVARSGARRSQSIKATSRIYNPDSLDLTLLAHLGANDFESVREIARALGESHVTISRRLQKLEEEGVIQGYYYAVSGEALGLETYRLLVGVTTPTAALRAKLRSFMLEHRWSVYMTEIMGPWDYELGFETPRAKDVIPIVGELYRLLGPSLREVKVLTELEELHSRFFAWTPKEFGSLFSNKKQ